jgi:hypothetical protein
MLLNFDRYIVKLLWNVCVCIKEIDKDLLYYDEFCRYLMV